MMMNTLLDVVFADEDNS